MTSFYVSKIKLAPINVIEWNSSGPVLKLSGFAPRIIDLVAHRSGFKYCWLPLGRDIPNIDFSATRKWLLSYLLDGSADLLISSLVRTVERYKLVDFTAPIAEGPFSVLIPYPEKTINRSAISQPFEPFVWALLLATYGVVVVSLYLVSSNSKSRFFESLSYVTNVLLGQGSYSASKSAASRLVAGVWCLAAFIFISAYSGTLLSFFMAPISKPLIDSFEDIPKVAGLKVAVDTDKAADLLIARSQVSRNITGLDRAFNAVQKSVYRCNVTAHCLDKVSSGNYVYIHGGTIIDQIIIDDLGSTGKCRFARAQKQFMNGFLNWAMPKKSPYNTAINNGILELDAFGLSNYWKGKFLKKADECSDKYRKPIGLSRLTILQLSSTFALLGIGYLLACIALIVEKMSLFKFRNNVVC